MLLSSVIRAPQRTLFSPRRVFSSPDFDWLIFCIVSFASFREKWCMVILIFRSSVPFPLVTSIYLLFIVVHMPGIFIASVKRRSFCRVWSDVGTLWLYKMIMDYTIVRCSTFLVFSFSTDTVVFMMKDSDFLLLHKNFPPPPPSHKTNKKEWRQFQDWYIMSCMIFSPID